MPANEKYVPFSQRSGLVETPPQLKIGQVSSELRRLIDYYLNLEVERVECYGIDSNYFDDDWMRVAQDFHVMILKKPIREFRNNTYSFKENISKITDTASIGVLFDFIEYFLQHPNVSSDLKKDITSAFVMSRAAYRVVDKQIIAIGTDEQAVAFQESLRDAANFGQLPARSHLIEAGKQLRDGAWADSVRESISAVEAVSKRLAPEKNTLGAALSELEKTGRLHGGLKQAFSALYGYTSDEEGVRHAKVFQEEAFVDEADALFMLGACASFVSYLIVRSG